MKRRRRWHGERWWVSAPKHFDMEMTPARCLDRVEGALECALQRLDVARLLLVDADSTPLKGVWARDIEKTVYDLFQHFRVLEDEILRQARAREASPTATPPPKVPTEEDSAPTEVKP